MTPDEINATAGEYVLGTLGAEERREVEALAARNADLAAAIRDWQARLAPLADAVPEVPPPPSVWQAIAAGIVPSVPERNAVDESIIQSLRRRIGIWRTTASLTGAVAVLLAAVIALGPTFQPSAGGERYVAVVNGAGDLPAFLVNVDTGTGVVSIASVTATAPPDHSYEFWYIGPAGADPLSLGVIDDAGRRVTVAADTIPGFATDGLFAVTVEQPGGSPTGLPSSSPVFTGRMIRVAN